MIRTAISAIALLAPAAALAAPVYLSCTMEGAAPLTATADEQQSIVTVMVEGTRAPQRLNAAFSPVKVTFGNGSISYVLDRRTLQIVRTVASMNWIDRGQCRIEKAPARAF